MRRTLMLVFLLAVAGDCRSLFSQSTQASGTALLHTFMIQAGSERGTAFSIDVDHREYWITAKHLFTGAKHGPFGTFDHKTAEASLLDLRSEGEQGHNQHWITETFTVLDPGKDIDILVLVPPDVLLPVEAVLGTDSKTVSIGEDCEFLGFPYGGGWRGKFEGFGYAWLPYVKHCTVSGQTTEDIIVWVLDGINNEGFSGGPVLFGNGSNQKIFAVISGYHQEPLDVLPAQEPTNHPTSEVPRAPGLNSRNKGNQGKQIVEANSGFILAFDIAPAMAVIRANPIGPLRPQSSPTDNK
jgi:hypothetical protein